MSLSRWKMMAGVLGVSLGGLAAFVYVFYHYAGIRKHGLIGYIKHAALPPGVPGAIAPLIVIIELFTKFVFPAPNAPPAPSGASARTRSLALVPICTPHTRLPSAS